MKTEQVLMTPEWAAMLLLVNTSNRPLRPHRVDTYVAAINSGQWKLTHQGIAIASNGIMLDGQHRLHAIVKTGKPMPIILSTDCDPSAFAVIDTGAIRSASDVLHVGGATSSHLAASTIRLCIFYEQLSDRHWHGRLSSAVTNSSISEWYVKHEGIVRNAIRIAHKHYGRFRKIPPSIYAFFAIQALLCGWEEEVLVQFFEEISEGLNLCSGSPVHSYRRALINDVIRGGTRAYQQQHAASIIFVFNAWVSGKRVALLRVPNFPPMPKLCLPVK